MKRAVVMMCSWVITAGALLAESSPEEMVIRYFQAFQKGDVDGLAEIMHEGELENFQQALYPAIAESVTSDPMGLTRQGAMVRLLTGGDDLKTIRDETPVAFYTRFMKWMIRINPAVVSSLSGATLQPLGSIPEDDMAHVVYRIQLDLLGANISQLKVMTVKKDDEGAWRLTMTGEIEGLGRLLQSGTAP
ncbi:MAG TPA: hypothetical protein PKE55_09165 [Kiritimatiellia bacterium]|nr:hypothetical protein [Kiritimatiellia bacterium]